MLSNFLRGNSVAAGTVKIFSAMMLLLPTGIIIAAFLSRQLGPELYGGFNVTVAIILWFQQVSTRVFGRAAVKFVAEADDWEQEAASILQAQLVFSVGLMALVIISAPLWETALNRDNLALFLMVAAIDIPLYSLSYIHGSFLSAQREFGRRALMHVMRWISRMVLVLVLVTISPSVYAALLGYAGASLMEFWLARSFIHLPLFRRAKRISMRFSAYALPIALVLIGTEIFIRLDLIFVEAFSQYPEASGYYGAAQNLTLIPTLFATALAPTLQATLSNLLKTGRTEAARNLSWYSIRIMLVMLPFATLVMAASKGIIDLIYGPEFAPAYVLLQVLIMGAVGIAIVSVLVSIFIAIGRPMWALVLWLPMLPAVIISHVLVVPLADALGAALATSLLGWLSAAVMIWAILSYWQLPLPIGTLARSAILCFAIWWIGSIWQTHGIGLIGQLAFLSVAIVVGYALMGEWPVRQLLLQQYQAPNPT